jgi:hypothetical protein
MNKILNRPIELVSKMLRSLKGFLLLVTSLVLLFSQDACAPSSPGQLPGLPSLVMTSDENALAQIVTDYVGEKYNWPKESYTIKLLARDGDIRSFGIINEPDSDARVKAGIAGGGKSFVVEVGVNRQIIRELKFQ